MIDLDTWEIIQRMRQGKRRPTKVGQQDMLSGLICCKDCGSRHGLCRCGAGKRTKIPSFAGKPQPQRGLHAPHHQGGGPAADRAHGGVIIELSQVIDQKDGNAVPIRQRFKNADIPIVVGVRVRVIAYGSNVLQGIVLQPGKPV